MEHMELFSVREIAVFRKYVVIALRSTELVNYALSNEEQCLLFELRGFVDVNLLLLSTKLDISPCEDLVCHDAPEWIDEGACSHLPGLPCSLICQRQLRTNRSLQKPIPAFISRIAASILSRHASPA